MRIALYAGTFDPITRGHLSVIERAARLFDRLLVVVAVNPDKRPLFAPGERVEMIRQVVAAWDNVSCAVTEDYVVHLARQVGARYLVRGIRGATDVEGEIALATANHALAPEVETVFVPAHPELSEVSSSRLKQLAGQGLDISRYCPAEIVPRLLQRLEAEDAEEGEGANE
jgi:pantetheine-phosphate adenylyltransferase